MVVVLVVLVVVEERGEKKEIKNGAVVIGKREWLGGVGRHVSCLPFVAT